MNFFIGIIIFVIIVIIVIFVVFFLIMIKKSHSAKIISASNTTVDLSALDEICMISGRDTNIDYWILSDSDYEKMKERLNKGKPLTKAMLKQNPPITIAYSDIKGNETIRDIILYRINGHIDYGEGEVPKEYDFHLEALCLLRNQERSFHTNGISAAWIMNKEFNLGVYLADLCRKTEKFKEAEKSRR